MRLRADDRAHMLDIDETLRTIMRGMGDAMMGTGIAEGEKRAEDAAKMAIISPLLEDASVDGAKGVIINITGGEDMSLAGDEAVIRSAVQQVLGTIGASDFTQGELPWRTEFGSVLFLLRHQRNDVALLSSSVSPLCTSSTTRTRAVSTPIS